MNSRLIISLILTVAAALGQSSLGSGVISILPTDGATGVPLNARIIVTLSYSEGYSPAAFTLTQAGAAVPGTLKVPDFTLPFQFGGPAGSPGYLVFVPAQQFLPSTQYRIEVDPPVINGVPNRPPVYASFTTGSTTDTTPLQLVSSTPTSGDAGVSPLANLLLKFNKPIDPHSTLQNPFALVAVASGSIPYPYPQAQISLDGTAVTLIGSSMTLGNAYMIQTSASTLTDWLGNPLGSLPAPIVFNTVPNPPANGPIAKAILPLNGDSNVPLNSAIVVIFDRPLAQLDDTAGISVTAGAEPPTAIAIDTTLAGGTVLTIRPQTLLPANSVVSVHIAGLRDIFGTLAAPLTLGFQTGASPETRVLAMSGPLANPVPRNGSITAVFNRPVNPVLLGLGGVTVNGVSQPWSLSKDWLTLTISPGQPFPAGVYGGQVWVPFDLIQGKLNPFPLSFSTTGSIDLTAPSVVAISPPDGTSDAPTNAVIDVAFSKPVQLIAGAPPSLILLESGTPVAGKFGLSTTSGRFVPSAPLDPSASYQIQISGIADLGGNALPAFSSSFQTSAATNPSTPFQVVSRSPASFATNVDPQTPITVTFNRDVDPVGLYQVFSGFLVSSGKMISGSFQVTGPVVTLTPAEPLTPGATYAAEPYGIADLAGQQVQEQATTFTVAAGGPSVDTTSPVVTSVSPGDAQPVLYSNPLVIFTFSKPIAITTVTAQNFRAYTAQKGNLNVTVNALSSTQVSLTFAADPGSAVTLYVNPGVTDLSGNPLVPFRSTVITTRPSTGPAALLGQRPSAQAGMIPPNSAISLYFSAPLDHASVERGLVVSANGAIVSGAISWIADSTALTFTPSSPLPWGAVVQWVLTWPAQDQAGNALSLLANGSNFLTVSPAPPANITVLGTNLQFPGPQPIDTIIELSFSAPVPDSFLNAGTATIMPESAYGQPAGAATPCIPSRVGPARIRFTPPSAVLTPNSYYTFAFDSGTGVKWFSSFNVSAAVTPPNPSVVAQGPSGNNVPLNAAVTLVFSGPAIMLNTPGGLTLSSGGVAIPATYAWSTTGYAVTLTPAGLLQPNTDYTVVASGFEDNAGHAIPDVSWNFHTGVALDLVPPTILRIAPSGDGVSPNAQISVSFSKPVSGNWIERFSVAGSAAPGLQSTPVAGTVRFSSDQQTLYFTPSSPFASGHTYTVQVPLIQDFEGNNQAAGASNNYFTTGSFRVGFAPQGPPQVTLTNPANGATGVPINAQMQVQFDQPVAADSLDGVVLYENGNVVASSARLEADGRTVTAIPANLPSAGSSYLMVVNGVRNTAGVSMSGAYQIAFTMGSTLDFTAPSFRSSPSDSQVDVPTNATVRVRFNEPLNALTAPSVLLSRSSLNIIISAAVTLQDGGKTLIVTPTDPLSESATYTLSLGSLTDQAGNALPNPFYTPPTIRFTTLSSEPATPVTLIATNPSDGSTGIPGTVAPAALLSEPVDLTLGDASFALVGPSGSAVGGTLTTTGGLISFQPSFALAPGTWQARLTGLADAGGNPLAPISWSFAVSSPVVLSDVFTLNSSNPARSSVGVPVASQITLQFNDPVNPISAATGLTVSWQNGTIPGTFTTQGNTVTFTPAVSLPGAAIVNVTGTVADYYGRTANGYLNFTTAASPDTTPPTLESSYPASGAVIPPYMSTISLRFSKPVVEVSGTQAIQIFAGASPLSSSFTVSEDSRTISASANFQPNTEITLALTANIQDFAGNSLAPTTLRFTTGSAVYYSGPQVISISPPDGAMNVDLQSPVEIVFAGPMDPSSVQLAWNVTDSGVLTGGAFTFDSTQQTFDFTPNLPWLAGSLVENFISPQARDQSGVIMAAFHTQFTTAGAMPAATASAVAFSASTTAIDVRFAGAVPTNIKDAYLRNGSTLVPTQVAVTAPDQIRITPDSPLEPRTLYHLVLDANQEIAIRTEQPDSVMPAIAAVIKESTGAFRLEFTRPVNPLSIHSSTRIVRPDGTSVPFSVKRSLDSTEVILVPFHSNGPLGLALEGLESQDGTRIAPQQWQCGPRLSSVKAIQETTCNRQE